MSKKETNCKCEARGKDPCDRKEAKIEELTADLKRVQAEFENYQKRVEQDFISREERIRSSLLSEMLSILDALNEGIKHEKDNKGLKQVKEVLVKFLHTNGVQKMTKKVGAQFNHNEMECMIQEKNEKNEDGEVLEVLQKGYFINDKVLRFAKVKVNKIDKKMEEN
jgi:molecular chaperone GrpE